MSWMNRVKYNDKYITTYNPIDINLGRDAMGKIILDRAEAFLATLHRGITYCDVKRYTRTILEPHSVGYFHPMYLHKSE